MSKQETMERKEVEKELGFLLEKTFKMEEELNAFLNREN